MRNRKQSALFLLIIISASLSLFLFGCSKSNGKQASRNASRGQAISVEAIVIQPQTLKNEISATGTMLANEEVELRSEISGRVVNVLFQEGKKVNKGDLLLKINDDELQAQFKRSEIEEKQASMDEERSRRLREIQAISQDDYDKVSRVLQMAQANKQGVEAKLAQTEIRAPFNGVVGLRYISEGGFVTPNLVIATLQEIDPMKIEFSVPEKYMDFIKPGAAIQILIANSDNQYDGKIYAVEPKVDLDTRTIKVRGRIPNSEGKLIPGSFANIKITLEEIPEAIIIPSQAIIPQIDGNFVFVYRDGKAVSTQVETGIRTESSVQITNGLSEADTLIVSGLPQLADGKAVQVKSIRND